MTRTAIRSWHLYLGGSGDDLGYGIAIDNSGNAFVSGITDSTNFEGAINAPLGGVDEFIAKVDSNGKLLWMDYVGDQYQQLAHGGIEIDSGGNAIAAYSHSATKVDTNGNIKWTVPTVGYGRLFGMAVDASDNILIAGDEPYSNLPGKLNSLHADQQDGFVMKLDKTGSVLWSRYIGWHGQRRILSRCGGHAWENPIVVGMSRSLQVEGQLNSNHGDADHLVTKLTPAGAVTWSLFIGNGSEGPVGIGPGDDILVAGEAGRPFVTQISSSGQLKRTRKSEAFGSIWAVTADSSGNILYTGDSTSYEGGLVRLPRPARM